MSVKDKVLLWCGPSWFAGITTGDWIRLLAQNQFRVPPVYWGRAAWISAYSALNTLIRWPEALLFNHRVKDVEVKAPLFILGHYRSGTTHLHNLMAKDDRFAHPNFFQVNYPHTFLCAERGLGRLFDLFIPRTRVMDNVALDFSTPYEDEWAMCVTTMQSPYMGWAFSHRQDHYDKYLTLKDLPREEVERWKQGLLLFLKKLTWKHKKSLILKSPTHTARVKVLLEMFPDAKFVHIHRDPYAVFQSTKHLWARATPYLQLQRRSKSDNVVQRILKSYTEMYDAYFEQRHLIPPGNLHELGYEDLEKDPLGEVQKAYEALNLPDFSVVRPKFAEYLGTLKEYKKNSYKEMDPADKKMVAEHWRRSFLEWGYPIGEGEQAENPQWEKSLAR